MTGSEVEGIRDVGVDDVYGDERQQPRAQERGHPDRGRPTP
jgi:hypothetical protein